jgi:hypothetical protein
MGEWRYSSTILDVAAFSSGKELPGTHWIGGWVGFRVTLDAVE